MSLMAASGGGSVWRDGSTEVRNTAELAETPRSLRSGKRASASWPRRCCVAFDMCTTGTHAWRAGRLVAKQKLG